MPLVLHDLKTVQAELRETYVGRRVNLLSGMDRHGLLEIVKS